MNFRIVEVAQDRYKPVEITHSDNHFAPIDARGEEDLIDRIKGCWEAEAQQDLLEDKLQEDVLTDIEMSHRDLVRMDSATQILRALVPNKPRQVLLGTDINRFQLLTRAIDLTTQGILNLEKAIIHESEHAAAALSIDWQVCYGVEVTTPRLDYRIFATIVPPYVYHDLMDYSRLRAAISLAPKNPSISDFQSGNWWGKILDSKSINGKIAPLRYLESVIKI